VERWRPRLGLGRRLEKRRLERRRLGWLRLLLRRQLGRRWLEERPLRWLGWPRLGQRWLGWLVRVGLRQTVGPLGSGDLTLEGSIGWSGSATQEPRYVAICHMFAQGSRIVARLSP
jgi:hypothetical protein